LKQTDLPKLALITNPKTAHLLLFLETDKISYEEITSSFFLINYINEINDGKQSIEKNDEESKKDKLKDKGLPIFMKYYLPKTGRSSLEHQFRQSSRS
jgi:hypothetical protein